ncbi:hypothetical protein JHK87_024524 [Glycine soja]|nr:hypothetical protein JHK87_024524 [Glycine soja]
MSSLSANQHCPGLGLASFPFKGSYGGRLTKVLSLTPSSIRSQRNPNPNPSPNPYQTRRRKLHDGDRSGMVVKGPCANLVMGQVKILKRGETLSPENPRRANSFDDDDGGFDFVLGSTNRLGPDPSSVPVPGFLALRR